MLRVAGSCVFAAFLAAGSSPDGSVGIIPAQEGACSADTSDGSSGTCEAASNEGGGAAGGSAGCGCGALSRSAVNLQVPSGVASDRSSADTSIDALSGSKSGASTGETEEDARVIQLPGGLFRMGIVREDEGDEKVHPADVEGPPRKVKVAPFGLGAFEVSNQRFAKFVEQTHYVSESEKFGWSFAVEALINPAVNESITQQVEAAPWWLPVEKAEWRQPNGPGTPSYEELLDHPVTQVSLADAEAFCAWSRPGGRLPTEAEWEFAARGGKSNRRFPWGMKQLTGDAEDTHRMNIWQSVVDHKLMRDGKYINLYHHENAMALVKEYYGAPNAELDGYKGTAPVDTFGPQNGFGFYNMVGNVWEWTSTHWTPPAGAPPVEPNTMVKRGGSFLCNPATCYRFRSSARMMFTADSAASNVGFRCAYPAAEKKKGSR